MCDSEGISTEKKEMIEDHWGYNRMIVEISFADREYIPKDIAINLMGYFYKKAMTHGLKHKEED